MLRDDLKKDKNYTGSKGEMRDKAKARNPDLAREIAIDPDSFKSLQQLLSNDHELIRALNLIDSDILRTRTLTEVRNTLILLVGLLVVLGAMGGLGGSLFDLIRRIEGEDELKEIWSEDKIVNGTSCANFTFQALQNCANNEKKFAGLPDECKSLKDEYCSLSSLVVLDAFGLAASLMGGIVGITSLVMCFACLLRPKINYQEKDLKDLLTQNHLNEVIDIAEQHDLTINRYDTANYAKKKLREQLIEDEREFLRGVLETKVGMHWLYLITQENLTSENENYPQLPWEIILHIANYFTDQVLFVNEKKAELTGEKESNEDAQIEKEKEKEEEKGKEKEEEAPLIQESSQQEENLSKFSDFCSPFFARPKVSKWAVEAARQKQGQSTSETSIRRGAYTRISN